MPLRLRRPLLEDEGPPAPPEAVSRFKVPGGVYGPTEAALLPTASDQLMTPEQWGRAGGRAFGAGRGDEFGPPPPPLLPREARGSTQVAATAGGTTGVTAPTTALQVGPPPGPPTEVGPATPTGGPPGPPPAPGGRGPGVTLGIGIDPILHMEQMVARGELPSRTGQYGRESTFADYATGGGGGQGTSLFERIMALGATGEERQKALVDMMRRFQDLSEQHQQKPGATY